ncbi:MAG: class I SAM-dependent methyltransferase [Pyrinomonadaceae bacterium]|nr:class I SAM-dependent methyltransferase [Pyrinomonadaceae bacterium]
MKKLRRAEKFNVSLEITDDEFVKPPSEYQRNSVLNRAMSEFCEDLNALDDLTREFIAATPVLDLQDRLDAELLDEEIMEDWQIPVLDRMAKAVTRSRGDVLEIGFGLGKSAEMIQKYGARSHTIIECNSSVIGRFREWVKEFPGRNISIIEGTWQETINETPVYDGILFHTYPLNEEEYVEYVANSTTFAEHFFQAAADHLHEGGVFTYFSNEIDSLSRGHQRALFEYFSSITESVVQLDIAEDVKDTWWSNKMVVVEAVK